MKAVLRVGPIRRWLVGLLIGLAFSQASAIALSPYQRGILHYAYMEGVMTDTGMVLPAVLMAESSLCIHLHSSYDPYGWGCGQLHVKSVGSKYTKARLLRDRALNIRLTASLIKECFKKYGYESDRGISCYNTGPYSRHINWRYVRKIRVYEGELASYLAEEVLRSGLSERLLLLSPLPRPPTLSEAYHPVPVPIPHSSRMRGKYGKSKRQAPPYCNTCPRGHIDEEY